MSLIDLYVQGDITEECIVVKWNISNNTYLDDLRLFILPFKKHDTHHSPALFHNLKLNLALCTRMCKQHAILYSECCHVHRCLVADPCEGGYVCPFTSGIKCEKENYTIVGYARDPRKQYCEACFGQIRVGKDRIVEYHLKLHMYLLQLLVDHRLLYLQFSRLIRKVDKCREWAIHGHYSSFGLYRPPDWNRVQYNFPTEQQIRDHEDQIRSGLAEAQRVGVLEYFSEGEGSISSSEESHDSGEAAEAGRESQRRGPTSTIEEGHDGEEVAWAGRENWRTAQREIVPRYHLPS